MGTVVRGILQSPHGSAVDALLTGALMQPAYEQVSAALKQRFIATVRDSLGDAHNFRSFVKDFALVRAHIPPSFFYLQLYFMSKI